MTPLTVYWALKMPKIQRKHILKRPIYNLLLCHAFSWTRSYIKQLSIIWCAELTSAAAAAATATASSSADATVAIVTVTATTTYHYHHHLYPHHSRRCSLDLKSYFLEQDQGLIHMLLLIFLWNMWPIKIWNTTLYKFTVYSVEIMRSG